MSMLDSLTPTQRTALYIGVPVVGLAVLVNARRNAAPADTPTDPAADPTGATAGYAVASTDAVGTGTLAQWSLAWSDAFSGLTERVSDLENKPTTTPTTPPTTGVTPPTARTDLGKRTTTSRSVQPPGRGWPGETPGEISLRVYGSRSYVNYIRYFNNNVWPGSPDKAIPAGTVIHY